MESESDAPLKRSEPIRNKYDQFKDEYQEDEDDNDIMNVFTLEELN